MSRIVVRDDVHYEVVVGWDAPLDSYFTIVYDVAAFKKALADDPDADEVIVLWEGASGAPIHDFRRIEELIEPYAKLSDRDRGLLALKSEVGI